MNFVASGNGLLSAWGLALVWGLAGAVAFAGDWPQHRGPQTDGSSPETIATTWPISRAGFMAWSNSSLTNGFSSFAVSGGRAFTLISRNVDGLMQECCVCVDAETGEISWVRPIGPAPWDPSQTWDGGSGTFPYNMGDGPRTTPSVRNDRVLALSGYLRLVCMSVTDGSVVWSNDLASAYGASALPWENGASPCLDDDLVFVSLNTSSSGRNLAAFRVSDGGLEWSSVGEGATHASPVVATIHGVRQVIFPGKTGLVSLDRQTGAFLWKFSYPFGVIGTSMGSSPVVHSNLVYCTAAYGKGAAAVSLSFNGSAWTGTQLYWQRGANYESIWMTPICYQGHIYTLSGNNGGSPQNPLNCIELATGTLKWSANGFGRGGLILINTNALALTETGALVLFDPRPDSYVERARYQAFTFSAAAPGKCWNNVAYSDGRIYARGTRGGVCLDVSLPATSPLKLLAPRFLGGGQLQVFVGTEDGSPISPERLSGIELRFADRIDSPVSGWPRLTNQLVLTPGGLATFTNTLDPAQPRQFYRAMESP